MTEAEAREVLEAYRRYRPRVLPAVVALAAANVQQSEIARIAGLTPAGVSVMLTRHRARITAGRRS